MDQVNNVLALARIYASRTSAPAGWNPNAPAIGFSMPNPMPHQLRRGQLAALQLDQAKLAENEKKRKLEQASLKKADTDVVMPDAKADEQDDEETMDPKKHISHLHDKEIERSKSDIAKKDEEETAQRYYRPPMKRQAQESQSKPPGPGVSMNLSDSSSEDDE